MAPSRLKEHGPGIAKNDGLEGPRDMDEASQFFSQAAAPLAILGVCNAIMGIPGKYLRIVLSLLSKPRSSR